MRGVPGDPTTSGLSPRRRGVVRLLLETGTAQPEAMRFYEREGYERIDNFGPYAGQPLSVCYARDL